MGRSPSPGTWSCGYPAVNDRRGSRSSKRRFKSPVLSAGETDTEGEEEIARYFPPPGLKDVPTFVDYFGVEDDRFEKGFDDSRDQRLFWVRAKMQDWSV